MIGADPVIVSRGNYHPSKYAWVRHVQLQYLFCNIKSEDAPKPRKLASHKMIVHDSSTISRPISNHVSYAFSLLSSVRLFSSLLSTSIV